MQTETYYRCTVSYDALWLFIIIKHLLLNYIFSNSLKLQLLILKFSNLIRISREDIKKGEIPSGNMHASARGLARLASAMANKGKLVNGKVLISENTWHQMHDKPSLKFDASLGN